ncbi:MAG: D-beta-D-heptose 7-phosphate kinase/D-beta-D-heptose 1-phosphate adenosyltransferase [Planctomycetota bacterium]|jgi:D-beta-D-heptose 7-phosphate kinase/D-beta-D-heptose 1-phosphate adenosyltransferase
MSDTQSLLGLLEAAGTPRVVIIGDLIIDRYVSGDVSRISPEAPIPVLAAKSSELRLGGAGNVAANLRAMDAVVEIVGVVGDDGHGRAMMELFDDLQIARGGVTVDATRPTIEKTRMLSGVHQMLRVDWEDARPLDGDALASVLGSIDASVEGADAVVLSDYGKGMLPPVVLAAAIKACRARGIPVLVDPKGTDYSRYFGATLITPNRKEAEEALGYKIDPLTRLPEAADELIRVAGLDEALITLGADGIYYRTKDGSLEGRVPTQARAVFDVTGAGDTVVAHLAFHLGCRVDLPSAVTLANHAAGIVVAKLGTHSVTRAEITDRLSQHLPHEGKVVARPSVGSVIDAWRTEGKRVVFTNGCFDVLHAGHVKYLRFSRSKGDALIVGVNDDASVARLKGPTRPVNTLEDRMEVLAALEFVDAVVAFDEDTPKKLVEQVSPDVLVKGEDYANKLVVGADWVEAHGGQVVLAPLLDGRSTTGILNRAQGTAGPSAGRSKGTSAGTSAGTSDGNSPEGAS